MQVELIKEFTRFAERAFMFGVSLEQIICIDLQMLSFYNGEMTTRQICDLCKIPYVRGLSRLQNKFAQYYAANYSQIVSDVQMYNLIERGTKQTVETIDLTVKDFNKLDEFQKQKYYEFI